MSVFQKIKALGVAIRERNHDAIRALLEDEDRGAMLSMACSIVVLAAKTVGVNWHVAPWRQIACEHDMELRIAMDIPVQFGWLAPVDRPTVMLNTDSLDYYRAMADAGAKKCLAACWRQSLWTQIRILFAFKTTRNTMAFGPQLNLWTNPPAEYDITAGDHLVQYTRWFRELIAQPTPFDVLLGEYKSVSYGTHYIIILNLTGSVALLEHVRTIDIWWARVIPKWLFGRVWIQRGNPTYELLCAAALHAEIDAVDDYYDIPLYTAIVRGTAAGLSMADVQKMLDLWPALLAAMIAHVVEGNLRLRAHYAGSRFERFWRIATRLPADLQLQFAATIYSVADELHPRSYRRLVCSGVALALPTDQQLRFVEAVVLG